MCAMIEKLRMNSGFTAAPFYWKRIRRTSPGTRMRVPAERPGSGCVKPSRSFAVSDGVEGTVPEPSVRGCLGDRARRLDDGGAGGDLPPADDLAARHREKQRLESLLGREAGQIVQLLAALV